MQSRLMNWAAVLLVVVGVAGAIWFARRGASPESENPPPANSTARPTEQSPADGMPGLKVEGAQITQLTPEGNLEWTVVASGGLTIDKDSGQAHGHEVRFELQQPGQSPLVVTAPEFEADYANQRLLFKAGVTGQLTAGQGGFTVQNLEYQMNTHKLTGRGGARFQYGTYEATAEEIVVDTEQHKVRLRGQVRFAGQG